LKNAFRDTPPDRQFSGMCNAENQEVDSFQKYGENYSTPATWPGQEVAWQGCVASLDILPNKERGEEDPYSQIALYSVNSPKTGLPSLKPKPNT
jgi:hypothetical protein